MFITGQNNFLMLVINILIDTATLYYLYKIALLIGVTKPAVKVFLISSVLYLNHIAYTGLFCSEIPFTFLFVLYIYRLLTPGKTSRSIDAVYSGMILGAGILIKPIVLFLPLLFLFAKKINMRQAVVQYAVIVLCILPLAVRNYLVMGEPILISLNTPVNLFIGNNPYANGTYRFDEPVQQLLGVHTSETEESRRAQELATNFITHHPMQALSLIPAKVYYQYISDVDGISSTVYGMDATHKLLPVVYMLRILAQLFYVCVMAAFVYSVVLYINSSSVVALLREPLILVILYYFVMYLPFFGAPRFHYVVMPFILLFIARYGLTVKYAGRLFFRGAKV